MNEDWKIDGLLPLNIAAEKLNISANNLKQKIKTTNFQAYQDKTTKKIYIENNFLVDFINHTDWLSAEFHTTNYILEKYDISYDQIKKYIKNNFPTGLCSLRQDRYLRIPKKYAESLIVEIMERYMPEDYIEAYKVREIMDISGSTFNRLVVLGYLGEPFIGINKAGRRVRAYQKERIEAYIDKWNKEKEFISEKGYLNYKEAVSLFPQNSQDPDAIFNLFHSGVFDDYYRIQYIIDYFKVYVSRESIIRYINERMAKYAANEKPIEFFNNAIDLINIPECIQNTVSIFRDYINEFIINNSSSNIILLSKASGAIKLINKCKQLLHKGLTEFSDKEIELLIKSPILNTLQDKKLLIKFLRYLKVVANCKFIENYSYAVIKLVEEEDTLDFETLIKYYAYVKDTKKHIARAIENRQYAVCWLYVTFHLCNAWRHGDVMLLPSVDLRYIGITSFDYFVENTLSIT